MGGVGDKYVVTGSPGNVDMVGNGFRLHGGGGVYLSDKDVDIGSDPFMYWQTNLADQVWSYDVDVSNVACKCNAAMYWVNMPEYETFEGNSETMSVAIHTCDYTPPNEY